MLTTRGFPVCFRNVLVTADSRRAVRVIATATGTGTGTGTGSVSESASLTVHCTASVPVTLRLIR
jgi:hypothetical protein